MQVTRLDSSRTVTESQSLTLTPRCYLLDRVLERDCWSEGEILWIGNNQPSYVHVYRVLGTVRTDPLASR
jgi:hypothetical protein